MTTGKIIALMRRTFVDKLEVRISMYQLEGGDTNIWSFYFDHAKWHAGSQFPYQGWSPHLLQWKRGILTTGPTGNSQHLVLNTTLHTSAKQCSNTASLNIPCPSMPSLCSKPIAKVSSMVNGEGRGSSFSDI